MEFITELKVKCMTTVAQCQGESHILLKYTYYIHKVVSPKVHCCHLKMYTINPKTTTKIMKQ